MSWCDSEVGLPTAQSVSRPHSRALLTKTHTHTHCTGTLLSVGLHTFSQFLISAWSISLYEIIRWWHYHPAERSHSRGCVGAARAMWRQVCAHMHARANARAQARIRTHAAGDPQQCCSTGLCMSPLQLAASYLAGAGTSLELKGLVFSLYTLLICSSTSI